MDGFALTMVLLTGLLALFTFGLWYVTRQLVQNSAATSERQLRAYLIRERAEISGFGQNELPECSITFKNFGQTPAHQISVKSMVSVVDWPLKGIPENKGVPRMLGTAGPGGTFRSTTFLDPAPNSATRDAIAREAKCIFAQVVVEYTDVFGHSRRSTVHQFHKGPLDSKKVISLDVYDEGNDAD